MTAIKAEVVGMIDPDALQQLEETLTDALADTHRIEVGDGVDVDKIRHMARLAAVQLWEGHAALSVLQPGDGTRYEIVVAAPLVADTWFVSLVNLGGRCHAWYPGNSVHTSPRYVLGKWTDDKWTAEVVAAFLNLLRTAWNEVKS